MTACAADVQVLIDKATREIAELRQNGTARMSKTGVRWCISSNRELLKRLRVWKRELDAKESTR